MSKPGFKSALRSLALRGEKAVESKWGDVKRNVQLAAHPPVKSQLKLTLGETRQANRYLEENSE